MAKTENPAAAEAKKPAKSTKKAPAKKESAKPSGTDTDKKFWELIYDLNSGSEEQLERIAVIDNDRPYTYRQFFRRMENYAEVFTGLGITKANNSRLGFIMMPSADALFAIYGANMIGVSLSAVAEMDIINMDRFIETIKKEAITDLMLDAAIIRPRMLREIMRRKEECGLNHVILMHSEYKVTKYISRMMKEMQDMNYRQLKNVAGVLDMHALMVKYEATPFEQSSVMDDAAYIVHTSGTTKGIHKPIPLSDKGINEAARRILDDPAFDGLRNGVLLFNGFLASSYHFLSAIHLPLAAGCQLIILPILINPFGRPDPAFFRAISDYKVTVVPTAAVIYRTALLPFANDRNMDLSSLEYVVMGGEYLSGQARKEINEFIAKKGGHAKVAVGYGLSEVGGAAILSAPGVEDDSIGYPMLGVKVKIQDETDSQFYDITDGPRSGGLYICSTSNSSGKIGDTQFFETEKIDGDEYICTYDRVTVNEDGSLTCHGRMNRFFINNEGIKFNAGLIEVSLNGEPDIEECALVPAYSKEIHDTVPALYVKTKTKGRAAKQTVEKSLYNVFVKEGKAEETNLPTRCVICESLPHNNSGKVDIYKIINDGLEGEEYAIVAVRPDGVLKDVKLMPGQGELMNPGTVPQEMEEEFRKFTVPFFNALNNSDRNSKGEDNMMPKFRPMPPLRPLMGSNPRRFGPMEAPQRPYDAFRRPPMPPRMGCNPMAFGGEPDFPEPPYDGFRRLEPKPMMGCNPEDDIDRMPSPQYNQGRFPFRKPRMGCNPFFPEDEDDD